MHLKNFRVCSFRIPSEKIRSPLKLVFLSDLHSVIYENPSESKQGRDPDGPNGKIVRAVDEIRPDAVLIGGDMIVSRQARTDESGWMDIAVDLMRRLAVHYPVYLADGNHEAQLTDPQMDGRFLSAYDQYISAVEEAGVIHLHNRYTRLNPPGDHACCNPVTETVSQDESRACRENHDNDSLVRLYGLDLDCITYEKWMNYPLTPAEITQKIGTADPSCYNIVMAHNPKYFPVYAEWGADLVLSGHIHGGIVRFGWRGHEGRGLLSPDWKLFPPYTAGEYHQASSTMILTAGIGTHTVPIRINNPPDICRIEITHGT